MKIDLNFFYIIKETNEVMKKISVRKRNGEIQEIDCAKIQNRILFLANGDPSKHESFSLPTLENVDVGLITVKVMNSIVNNISTTQIDEEAAKICSELAQVHIEYSELASRIIISNHHKNTRMYSFMGVVGKLYRNEKANIISRKYYKFVEANQRELDQIIDYKRDYMFSYFGFKTLEKKYLFKLSDSLKPIERPQHMFMRIAIELSANITDKNKQMLHIKKTYDALSTKKYTHASPTIFNSGTDYKQCLSCFLLGSEDSRRSIMKTGTDISEISKRAGGIGFHFNWRSEGSLIRGTNGYSSGPIPFIKMYDSILSSFNQGGKRAGSGAAYIPIDHPDVEAFMELRIPHKSPEDKAADIFLAVSIPDLFMIRCYRNEDWNLFDPDECPMLASTYGDEYEKYYLQYEKAGKSRKTVKARDLAKLLAKCKIESGMPYTYYKDMCNRKSNQKNLGTIRSSNLCAEIVEYSDTDEYACCVLASICLPSFIKKDESGCVVYDFDKLRSTVALAIKNLDIIIDNNTYPCPETELSNIRHRPLGVGVQGLADVYMMMGIPFDSKAALELNSQIFENIYYASLNSSCEISRQRYLSFRKELKKTGAVCVEKSASKINSIDNNKMKSSIISQMDKYVLYSSENISDADILIKDEYDLPTDIGSYMSYKNSPISNGKFQFDLWEDEYSELKNKYPDVEWYSSSYVKKLDWETLRQKIKKFGVRNSLCVALMPTASTAQIQNNNECFEPYTSNIYRREVDAGDFICVNKHLIADLCKLNIWSEKVKDQIIIHRGSVQHIPEIPNNIKQIYKTAWEIKQKTILEHAAARAQFIDQSQSLNLFFGKQSKTISKVTSSIMSAWKYRLKTQYYVRTQESNSAQNYTIDAQDELKYMELIKNNDDSGCSGCAC